MLCGLIPDKTGYVAEFGKRMIINDPHAFGLVSEALSPVFFDEELAALQLLFELIVTQHFARDGAVSPVTGVAVIDAIPWAMKCW